MFSLFHKQGSMKLSVHIGFLELTACMGCQLGMISFFQEALMALKFLSSPFCVCWSGLQATRDWLRLSLIWISGDSCQGCAILSMSSLGFFFLVVWICTLSLRLLDSGCSCVILVGLAHWRDCSDSHEPYSVCI